MPAVLADRDRSAAMLKAIGASREIAAARAEASRVIGKLRVRLTF